MKNTKTSSIVMSAFNSELGQQLDTLYTTSDNHVFIRLDEAFEHIETKKLVNVTIIEWSKGDNNTLVSSIRN